MRDAEYVIVRETNLITKFQMVTGIMLQIIAHRGNIVRDEMKLHLEL